MTLDYIFSQSFKVTGNQFWTVTDDANPGGSPIDVNGTSGTNHYRIIAARTASAAKTISDPGDLIHWVNVLLGTARWTVRMQSNGIVRIISLNAGAASIDITAGVTIAVLLGVNGSIGSPVLSFPTTNSYVDFPCLPTHTILAEAFFPDKGWQRRPAKLAGKTLPTGEQTGWGGGRQGWTRTGEIGLIPIDWAYAQPNGLGTPMYPTLTTDARWNVPSTDEPNQEPPWSVEDQLGNQIKQTWGCCFGTLQNVLAGTDTKFDVCGIPFDALKAEESNFPTLPGYDRRWQQQMQFTRISQGTRT